MFATGLTTVAKGRRGFDPESLGAWDRGDEREVPAVSGCFQLIDRSLWNDLGGLDERYFMYGEDADWAARARAVGARPRFVPSAEIIHDLGGSSTAPQKRVMVMRGKSTFLRLRWPVLWPLGLALLQMGTLLRGPVANSVRRLGRRRTDDSWAETWRRRREWRAGW